MSLCTAVFLTILSEIAVFLKQISLGLSLGCPHQILTSKLGDRMSFVSFLSLGFQLLPLVF